MAAAGSGLPSQAAAPTRGLMELLGAASGFPEVPAPNGGHHDDFENVEEGGDEEDDRVPFSAKDLPPGGVAEEAAPKKVSKAKDPFDEFMNQMPQLLKEGKVEMRDCIMLTAMHRMSGPSR